MDRRRFLMQGGKAAAQAAASGGAAWVFHDRIPSRSRTIGLRPYEKFATHVFSLIITIAHLAAFDNLCCLVGCLPRIAG